MTHFFISFLSPDEEQPQSDNLSHIKEVFALDEDEFESAHDVLFRKYDLEKDYDARAKKYNCEKMPWKLKDIPSGLREGIAKSTFLRFPHSEYFKMRRYITLGNYFFATWNYQLGQYRVGAPGGYGYEQQTIDMKKRDLRKLIQRVVDAYNKTPEEDRYSNVKFEAVPTTKKWDPRNFLGMRVIGMVVSNTGPEMLVIESKEDVQVSDEYGGDPYGDPF